MLDVVIIKLVLDVDIALDIIEINKEENLYMGKRRQGTGGFYRAPNSSFGAPNSTPNAPGPNYRNPT